MVLLFGLIIAAGLVLYALRQNINLYLTPSQLKQENHQNHREFRLGGLVVKGSLKQTSNNLKMTFVLTDFHQTVLVHYEGLLPVLFREGQGIIAEGYLQPDGSFQAEQVLAKHDENYKPPEIK